MDLITEPAALSPALLDGLQSLQHLKHLESAAKNLTELPAAQRSLEIAAKSLTELPHAARSLQTAAKSLELFHLRLVVCGLGFWVLRGLVQWAIPSKAPIVPASSRPIPDQRPQLRVAGEWAHDM